MSKIEQNREKKREAILAAAKSVFLSGGYTLANMDEIAAQAKMTKQTLYRYFPSKVELFQATLHNMGANYSEQYTQHLELENSRDALTAFAIEFMRFHLSQEHIATQRLLIAEAAQAPEIVESFMGVGPNDTHEALQRFFVERFDLQEPSRKIELWLGMLLAPRSHVMLGFASLSLEEIEQHVAEATEMLLSGLNT